MPGPQSCPNDGTSLEMVIPVGPDHRGDGWFDSIQKTCPACDYTYTKVVMQDTSHA